MTPEAHTDLNFGIGDLGVIWLPGQPIYDVIALEICLQTQRDGLHPVLIELDSVLGTSFDTKEVLAYVFSRRLRGNWSRMIANTIARNGIEVRSAPKTPRMSQPAEDLALTLLSTLKTPHELDSLRDISRELADSVYSALCTDSLRAYHQPPKAWKRKARKLIRAFFDGSRCMNELEAGLPPKICIPNGRFPHQAGIDEACRRLQRSVLYYEVGGSRHQTFHLEDHRTQSRKFLARKEELLTDLESKGLQYLRARQFDPASNTFALQMDTSHDHASEEPQVEVETRKVVTYFSSSMDEFVGQGNDWPAPRWADQWLALDDLVPALKKEGFEIRVRIHPNTLNKTWREFLWIERRARSLGCEVIPSWSSRNSYGLALESDLVLSWGSTIALEAAALGKLAAIISPTFFDTESGVLTIEIDHESRIKLGGRSDHQLSAKALGMLAWHGHDFAHLKDLLTGARKAELGYAKNLRLAGRVVLPIELWRRPQVARRIADSLCGEVTKDLLFGKAVSRRTFDRSSAFNS